ncbi:MAG: hypothetical protein EOM20_21700, partial [Spartobacteria bacterium]|nr:hypothetical protein [Spartobacteria bacterium]
SELQGGAFNQGFTYGPAVPGALQQCWTWSAIARGAKGVIYWCWRDEVWGVESGGYGLLGQDGMSEDRIEHLQRTGHLLNEFEDLLDAYRPDPAHVGILYNSNDVILAATNREQDSRTVSLSINAVMRVFEQERIPFDVLDGRHLRIPNDIKLLVLPACFTLDKPTAETIHAFLEQGGWVFSEAGAGMFTEAGFFHDRCEERPLVGALGIKQLRRHGGQVATNGVIPADTFGKHEALTLKGAIWSIGMAVPDEQVVATNDFGEAILVDIPAGKGRFIMSGSFPAHAFGLAPYPDFRVFMRALAREAGALPEWALAGDPTLEDLFVRTGYAGRTRLFFIINMGEERTLRVRPAERNITSAEEWVDGHHVEADADGWLTLCVPPQSHRILSWPKKPAR